MIGILGGTFDPIHFGHIKPALDLLALLPLDEIRFIPCRIPPHRSQPQASAQHRWRMVEMVVNQQAGFVADSRELRREGTSYTIDTLEDLRRDLGTSDSFCLILGNDAFCGFTQWCRWQEILTLAHILVTKRPGVSLPTQGDVAQLLQRARLRRPEELTHSSSGGILPCAVSQVNISSTEIRACIRAGKQPRFLIPGPVWAYIRREGLYGVPS
jgi:nicotinate-nucleotide adenylyltransferase